MKCHSDTRLQCGVFLIEDDKFLPQPVGSGVACAASTDVHRPGSPPEARLARVRDRVSASSQRAFLRPGHPDIHGAIGEEEKPDTLGRSLAAPTDAPHSCAAEAHLRVRGGPKFPDGFVVDVTQKKGFTSFSWKTRCCGAARCSAWPFPQCTSSCTASRFLTSWQYLLLPGPLGLRGAAISSCETVQHAGNAMHRVVAGVRIERSP